MTELDIRKERRIQKPSKRLGWSFLWKWLMVFEKRSISDVWQSSENASGNIRRSSLYNNHRGYYKRCSSVLISGKKKLVTSKIESNVLLCTYDICSIYKHFISTLCLTHFMPVVSFYTPFFLMLLNLVSSIAWLDNYIK